jgi:cytochrome oxidase Cu insertion factor (SCO1/SenC/PrrC family)
MALGARAGARPRRRALRGLAALLLASLAAPALADAHAAHPAPDAPAARFEAPVPGSYELPPIDRVAQHQLLGTSGRPEPLLDLKRGELALISFVYLSCGEACPLATALLHRLDGELARQPDLARRVELVTVSFDPRRDTPAAMRALEQRLAPKGRWRFLTAANEAALRPVLADFGQDAVWIPGGENAPDALRHVLKVFVVDAHGAIRQIYSTGYLDVRLVFADLRTLLAARP